MYRLIRNRLLIACMIIPGGFAAAVELDQLQPYQAARSSSYMRDGSNGDRVIVAPNSSYVVADLEGAGRIVHMWFTIGTAETKYLETTKLRIYWDGASLPSVDVPFGLFHALGHSEIRPVDCAFLSVQTRPELNVNLRENRNLGGFNSYFPMPFADGAKVVIENASDQIIRLYFQVDYQKWQRAPSSLRFHAQFRETAPEAYPGPEACGIDVRNPDGRDNHLICETAGRGHIIGVVLSIDAAGEGWWEGDDMTWIDGESHPSIYGTGTEDYFGGAWGFRQEYSRPYHGVSVLKKVAGRQDWKAGLYTVYRFLERDPIPFLRSIKMSIERGHNNCRRDSTYQSIAYWYQE